MGEHETPNITEDEAALYDRQIRLWGLDAQRRLRAATVLLIGLRGLGAELAKNTVLAGVKAITLMDSSEVSEEDSCSQFLVSRDAVGKNRAESSIERTQLLNPMVKVSADKESVDDKPDDFFTKFDVICATCCSQEAYLRLNKIARENKIKFFCGDVYGFYGFSFTDLLEHEYAVEIVKLQPKKSESGEPSPKKQKTDDNVTTVVKKSMDFVSLKEALSVDWSDEKRQKELKKTSPIYFIMQVLQRFHTKQGHLPNRKTNVDDKKLLTGLVDEVLESLHVTKDVIPQDFISNCVGELSPVCAVVGGMLAQEIIKAISQKDAPLNNFFLFDGLTGTGIVEKIGY